MAAYTTVKKPTDYFNTVKWTGDGTSSRNITGVGFQPDWTWIKCTDENYDHNIFNSTLGANKYMLTNSNAAEVTVSNRLNSWNADGFNIGDATNVNKGSPARNYAAFNWKANGATGSSNSNGATASTVSADTTRGFSIVKWTGTGSDTTVGHGLSSAPQMYVVKNRDTTSDWRVAQTIGPTSYRMTTGNGHYMEWNDPKASTNPGGAVMWGSTPTAPTNQVFTVGSNNSVNKSGDDMMAYCFHSVRGYSKIAYYVGTGDNDGAFIYTGFKPAWLIVKRLNGSANWIMFSNKVDGYNVDNGEFTVNSNSTVNDGQTYQYIDFCATGFKWRENSNNKNSDGDIFMYMAFAEEPLIGDNPATAR
mgnify:CR=1 FL=1